MTSTNLFSYVNPDQVVDVALSDIYSAVVDWLKGNPHEEVVLLNRLTKVLGRRRKSCDVGVKFPINVQTYVTLLHRKGFSQQDLYGSDLAVTAIFRHIGYVKTAFFQLKRSYGYSTQVQRDQLENARLIPSIGNRSFVLAADEKRPGVRVAPVEDLMQQYNSVQQIKNFDSSDWISLTQWILGWLSCNVGSISPQYNGPIETLLYQYLPQDRGFFTRFEGVSEYEMLDELQPAVAWLAIEFVGSESEQGTLSF